MYLDHFQLTEPPFLLTPDPRFLYLSKSHSRALTFMQYAIENRDGFAVITGEVGSGKTTLISKMLTELDEDTIVARIYHTHVGSIEFLQSLLDEFDIHEYMNNKVSLLNQINAYLINAYSENKKVILIVDEAQNLSEKLLEEIRLLTDLETNNEKLMNLILVGQPELNETLDQPQLEQLTQRIRFRFHIGPLTEKEMRDFINHRLFVAGVESKLFDEGAMPLIYKYTGGIPRLINALCDVVLICGFSEEAELITKGIVQAAINELEWKPFNDRYKHVDKSELKRKIQKTNDGKLIKLIEDKINRFVKSQDKTMDELTHLFKRLEVKIEAYEDKLSDLNKELKKLSRKIK